MLITGMLLFLVIRSFLESGLIDATPSFLLFMTMSMLAEAGTRPTLVAAAACWVAPAKVPRRRRAPAVHRALLRR
jgi:hypothetical protein